VPDEESDENLGEDESLVSDDDEDLEDELN
jgi:hypothetical protein